MDDGGQYLPAEPASAESEQATNLVGRAGTPTGGVFLVRLWTWSLVFPLGGYSRTGHRDRVLLDLRLLVAGALGTEELAGGWIRGAVVTEVGAAGVGVDVGLWGG
jgi:hypothetical protein